MDWKKKCVVLIAVFIGLAGFALIHRAVPEEAILPEKEGPGKEVVIKTPGRGQYLSPEEMEADLNQLEADIAAVHPLTGAGVPPELDAAFAEAYGQVGAGMTVGEFYTVAAGPLSALGDAHTLVYPPQGGGLAADLKVIDGRLYALGGKNLKPGDELLSLGGVSIEAVLVLAEKIIPAENPYWRQYRIVGSLNEQTLISLGAQVEQGRVEARLRRQGEEMAVSLSFNGGWQPQPPDYEYTLNIEERTCHFQLRMCISDRKYSDFIYGMFEAIQVNEIEHLVLDLRGNPGGTAGVLSEFLRYIDIEEYKDYGFAPRMSQAVADNKGILALGTVVASGGPKVVKNRRSKDFLFGGDIYLLIDNGTFSAANMFGVVLADNKLATLVGEPSGNAPSFFADILPFQLVNSGLSYTISTSKLLAPGLVLQGDLDALYPDYPVRYTIDDYVNKRDLALEEAMRLIREGE